MPNEWKCHWLVLYFVQVNPFEWCIERDNYLCISCAPIRTVRHTQAQNECVHRYTKPKNNKHTVVSNETKIKIDANELSRYIHTHIHTQVYSFDWIAAERDRRHRRTIAHATSCHSPFVVSLKLRLDWVNWRDRIVSMRCSIRPPPSPPYATTSHPAFAQVGQMTRLQSIKCVPFVCDVYCIHVCRFASLCIASNPFVLTVLYIGIVEAAIVQRAQHGNATAILRL